MPVDAYATQPHLIDHLAPIWSALDPDERGTFIVEHRRLAAHADALGIATKLCNDQRLRGGPILVANRHDLVGCYRGRPAIFVEHGAGQHYTDVAWHPAYAGGNGRETVALFLALNETTAARDQARYPDAAVEVIGSANLDRLASGRLRSDSRDGAPVHRRGRRVVAFAWHWHSSVVPEAGSAWAEYRHAMRAMHDSGRYEVLGHGHPRAFPDYAQTYHKWGIEPVADFAEVLARADVVCFDNTSAGYEAAALGVPVVALNSKHYRRDVHHGLRFWDQVPGPQVDDPDDLAPTVDRLLGDDETMLLWWEVRRVIAAQVYPVATRGRVGVLGASAIRRHIGSA